MARIRAFQSLSHRLKRETGRANSLTRGEKVEGGFRHSQYSNARGTMSNTLLDPPSSAQNNLSAFGEIETPLLIVATCAL